MRRNIDGPFERLVGHECQIDPNSFAFFPLCRKSPGSLDDKVSGAARFCAGMGHAMRVVFL
jgi:hypothetical protein